MASFKADRNFYLAQSDRQFDEGRIYELDVEEANVINEKIKVAFGETWLKIIDNVNKSEEFLPQEVATIAYLTKEEYIKLGFGEFTGFDDRLKQAELAVNLFIRHFYDYNDFESDFKPRKKDRRAHV